MENPTYNYNIPETLRKKYVNSRISHEIFFIDCINDLIFCLNSKISYHLIRSSGILRMLLLDGGLNTISKNYNLQIQFLANQEQILGSPLTGKETVEIKNLLKNSHRLGSNINALYLTYEPLQSYSLEKFIEKICLKIERDKTYNFSVENIIKIIANKHGAAHLESTFDSSTVDSFHMGNFSPFSMKYDNFFLEKIKEIIIISITALLPLCNEIIKNLVKYDNENIQVEDSSFAYIMTNEEIKDS